MAAAFARQGLDEETARRLAQFAGRRSTLATTLCRRSALRAYARLLLVALRAAGRRGLLE